MPICSLSADAPCLFWQEQHVLIIIALCGSCLKKCKWSHTCMRESSMSEVGSSCEARLIPSLPPSVSVLTAGCVSCCRQTHRHRTPQHQQVIGAPRTQSSNPACRLSSNGKNSTLIFAQTNAHKTALQHPMQTDTPAHNLSAPSNHGKVNSIKGTFPQNFQRRCRQGIADPPIYPALNQVGKSL